LAHIDSSLIWIGRLKVEWVVRLTTSKVATIPNDVTHITIFSSLQNLTMIVLYKNVLFVLVGPSRKNVVPFCSIIDVKTS
jgi:hypothetical protein